MADKAKLNDMVDSLIDQKPEDAQIFFHDYLKTKIGDLGASPGDNESEIKDNEE